MSYTIRQNQIDSHQTSSSAILAVFPFANRDTGLLAGNDIQSALETRPAVVVVSDILSASISSTKSSPMMTAEILLSSGHLNYTAQFSSGDHAMVWLVNNQDDFDNISKSILANQPSNQANSGLKMVGRVNSVRQTLTTSPDGKKTFRYLVTIKGFAEFESQIYYNELLASSTNQTLATKYQVFSDLSKSWNDLFKKGKIGVSDLIDFYVDVFFGSGPSNDFTGKSYGVTRSPNKAFLVPNAICKLLGVTLKEEKAAANKYADLLYTMIGIQEYSPGSETDGIGSMIPSNLSQGKGSASNQFVFTGNSQLQGSMIAPPSNFNNVNMWSLLQASGNLALNEMYCTLKPFYRTVKGKSGYYLQPTFIARQVPLTTKKYQGTSKNTKFMSLPRWKLHDDYPVMSYNLGVSDAARFNFWQCNISNPELQSNPSLDLKNQLEHNTVIDDLDIARNGPRIFTTSSAIGLTNSEGKIININDWRDLIADWYTNLHYYANGSITMAGIQDPISVGDNFEFDGKVFHIESVSHSYQVAPQGSKSFTTTIALSHGLLTNGDYLHDEARLRSGLDSRIHLPGYSDEELYINDKIIVSGGTETTQDKPSFTSASTSETLNQIEKTVTSKIDSLKKKFGL